jgi:hypothetical protein
MHLNDHPSPYDIISHNALPSRTCPFAVYRSRHHHLCHTHVVKDMHKPEEPNQYNA